jgi:hypothetical protein
MAGQPGDPERLVTAWSRLVAFRHAPSGTDYPPGAWMVERSYPLRYWRDVHGLSLEHGRVLAGREWRLFERGVDPNEPKEAPDG